jgi:Ca-activated chloride channel homolog
MNLEKVLAGIGVGLVIATSACAQTTAVPLPAREAPTSALKADSRLVAFSVIVRNATTNEPVSDLTPDDFILKEDGKPQEISFFSQRSDLPFTLALMIDTSGSQTQIIGDEVAASRAFFPAVLTRPGDLAVVVKFDTTVTQLAAMTHSVATLQKQLELLSPPPPRHGHSAQSRRSNPRVAVGGATLLYDAIYAVANYELSDQMGLRAMVIITDGGDVGSSHTVQDAVNAALSHDIIIYSLYYSTGDTHENPGVLKLLSRFTGGRFFEVGSQTNLGQIYAEVANEMRLQYEIGYQPPDSEPGMHHKIELKARDKSLTVLQARPGYNTPK